MPIFFIAIIKLPMSMMDTGNQHPGRKHYETERLHLILVQDLPTAWSGQDNADHNHELHPEPSIDRTIVRKGTCRDPPARSPDLFDGRISPWKEDEAQTCRFDRRTSLRLYHDQTASDFDCSLPAGREGRADCPQHRTRYVSNPDSPAKGKPRLHARGTAQIPASYKIPSILHRIRPSLLSWLPPQRAVGVVLG